MLVPHAVSGAGSVVLTQTHPAAPYVCRTGNITLRCQYDGVENVLVVLWSIGAQTVSNSSGIIGHTALPHTTTYQEVVVDNYTNLATGYRCVVTLSDISQLQSNLYTPQIECKFYSNTKFKLQPYNLSNSYMLFCTPRCIPTYALKLCISFLLI